jgi:hypothetical protein
MGQPTALHEFPERPWRSTILSFKFMDKQSRFTRDVLFYSVLIIEECGCRANQFARVAVQPANPTHVHGMPRRDQM